MKTGLLSLAICIATSSFAQKINLTKNQQIIAATNSTQNTSLMGMTINGTSQIINKIIVTDVKAKQYNVSSTITKLAIHSDFIVQKIDFNSDNKDDRTSEIGKALSSKIDSAEFFTIDGETGSTTSKNNIASDNTGTENPLVGVMGNIGEGTGAAMVSSIFFLPEKRNIGDTWKDSTIADNIKTITNYTVKSIENDVATINSNFTSTGATTMDFQGNNLKVDLNTTGTAETIVDLKTALVKKRNSTVNVDGKLDVMGQSMPLTSTVTTTTSFD
jgi:hypothetical protein